MDRVNVLITFPLEDELIEAVRAVDPRVAVRVLNREERALYRREHSRGWLIDPAPPPPEGRQAETALQSLNTALAEAEVIYSTIRLPSDLLQRSPRLRWLQLTAAGVDRLAGTELVQSGRIVVTSAAGATRVPIREYVLAVMLMLTKDAPRFLRQQRERVWDPYHPLELCGKTVGIVGMGAIGSDVARLCRAFEMRVLGIRRSVSVRRMNDPLADELLPPSDLHYLLAQSDYVVLAVPLTPDTDRLIGEAELKAMKPTAYLINIARGSVIDEAALIRALKERWIAGAGLDVFEQEPLPSESELWDLPNVILSPHLAGGSEIYNQRITGVFLENLGRYIRGETLINVVDPKLGY